MGSSRLPGKALRVLGGYTMLAHIVQRLRRIPSLDMVAVATTERPEDDLIVEHCRQLDVCCLRGPEKDVMERYVMAGEYCQADIVVRATGDNPLIDPGSVQRVIEALQAGGFDFAIEQGLPKGCCGEVFTLEALRRARECALLSEHREHVTLVMKQDHCRFNVCVLNAPEELQRPDVNLSIDTEEEYQFVKSAMEIVDSDALSVSVAEVLVRLPKMSCSSPVSKAC
jgi:spore coat polysaccharide biosynthesis protein SpsF